MVFSRSEHLARHIRYVVSPFCILCNQGPFVSENIAQENLCRRFHTFYADLVDVVEKAGGPDACASNAQVRPDDVRPVSPVAEAKASSKRAGGFCRCQLPTSMSSAALLRLSALVRAPAYALTRTPTLVDVEGGTLSPPSTAYRLFSFLSNGWLHPPSLGSIDCLGFSVRSIAVKLSDVRLLPFVEETKRVDASERQRRSISLRPWVVSDRFMLGAPITRGPA